MLVYFVTRNWCLCSIYITVIFVQQGSKNHAYCNLKVFFFFSKSFFVPLVVIYTPSITFCTSKNWARYPIPQRSGSQTFSAKQSEVYVHAPQCCYVILWLQWKLMIDSVWDFRYLGILLISEGKKDQFFRMVAGLTLRGGARSSAFWEGLGVELLPLDIMRNQLRWYHMFTISKITLSFENTLITFHMWNTK